MQGEKVADLLFLSQVLCAIEYLWTIRGNGLKIKLPHPILKGHSW